MTSCVTRKTQTNHIDNKVALEQTDIDKKDLTVQDSANVKTSNEVMSTDETTTIRTTYTPIDPKRLSTYTDEKGTKKELNNTSLTEEKTFSKSNKKAETLSEVSTAKKIVDKGTTTGTTVGKSEESKKSKATEKRVKYYWLLWLIPIVGSLYYLKRLKNFNL